MLVVIVAEMTSSGGLSRELWRKSRPPEAVT